MASKSRTQFEFPKELKDASMSRLGSVLEAVRPSVYRSLCSSKLSEFERRSKALAALRALPSSTWEGWYATKGGEKEAEDPAVPPG